MAPLIISVSGMRGEIGTSLTLHDVNRYAVTYSSTVEDSRPFLITWDSRPSGRIIADSLHAHLNAIGRNTIDGGIAATPTTGILIRKHGCAGGIQISASHNPAPFNGLKLFSSLGRVIPAREGEQVLKSYLHINEAFFHWVPFNQLGKKQVLDDTIDAHLEAVLKTVDAERIREKKFRVLLDSNNGSGSVLGIPLLEVLGCSIVSCGEFQNGDFLHTPEPIGENLAPIADKVRESGVDIGFCQDPDADRLAIIDASGHYPGEECTVALCALNLLEKSQNSGSSQDLVINCATSRMSEDLANEFHGSCFRSAVGEANVVDLLLEKKALFAGEGNGGPIDPRVGLVRDSFVGIANILDLMARHGEPVAQLINHFVPYSIIKRKMPFQRNRLPDLFQRLEEKFPDRTTSRLDGLRMDGPDFWVLVRSSNTEPVIRIIAEAPSKNAANALCDEIEKVIEVMQ
ncbi:MAG: phosphoglucosamine mutase [Planctomycetia bacterium]|nr:phosphoglucosamine mutase [Planctomycetia bacterium]